MIPQSHMSDDPAPQDTSAPRGRWVRLGTLQRSAEDVVVSLFLLAMAVIPIVEFTARRWFSTGIPGSQEYLQHLTLWVAFLGACLASREGEHLKIAAVESVLPPRWKARVEWCTSVVSAPACVRD